MEKTQLNILVIDDAPEYHELYRLYLQGDQEVSYHFLNAYNGCDGQKLYQENAVDCVILDYRLPDIDGIEVLRKLARINSAVPVVMLTGEGNERVAVLAMQVGTQNYIPKSVVTPQALRRTIQHAVERAQLMQRVEAYRHELERSNEDLQRFANVVAHDLKSPLRAIAQHLQIIRNDDHAILSDTSKKSFEFAIGGAERMRQLIDSLFEFSKAGFEKRAFELVDCNVVMDSVRSNLASHVTESGAAITSDSLPTIMGDGVQIMQLLQNLIGNALKFCREKPCIHISARQERDKWIFSVHDNGIGIPRLSQDKIFTIFKRLHKEEEYPGHGIGLAICERVVKNHGGSITVKSEPGSGSTFLFTFPVHKQATQEKAT